jgi:hypothetical protein
MGGHLVVRAKDGRHYLTVGPSILARHYLALHDQEGSSVEEFFETPELGEARRRGIVRPFANWLDRYGKDPAQVIATANWGGKVTGALFSALGIRRPKTKKAMLNALFVASPPPTPTSVTAVRRLLI